MRLNGIRGISIIELLVIVTIMAIVAVIGFATLYNARKGAQDTLAQRLSTDIYKVALAHVAEHVNHSFIAEPDCKTNGYSAGQYIVDATNAILNCEVVVIADAATVTVTSLTGKVYSYP